MNKNSPSQLSTPTGVMHQATLYLNRLIIE